MELPKSELLKIYLSLFKREKKYAINDGKDYFEVSIFKHEGKDYIGVVNLMLEEMETLVKYNWNIDVAIQTTDKILKAITKVGGKYIITDDNVLRVYLINKEK